MEKRKLLALPFSYIKILPITKLTWLGTLSLDYNAESTVQKEAKDVMTFVGERDREVDIKVYLK
jgi:hypothetical protein